MRTIFCSQFIHKRPGNFAFQNFKITLLWEKSYFSILTGENFTPKKNFQKSIDRAGNMRYSGYGETEFAKNKKSTRQSTIRNQESAQAEIHKMKLALKRRKQSSKHGTVGVQKCKTPTVHGLQVDTP